MALIATSQKKQTITLGNFAANGSIGTAPNTVDVSSAFSISQTTTGITLTIPNPTVTQQGDVIDITNTGTVSVIVGGVTLPAGKYTSFVWNGSAWIPLNAGSSSPIPDWATATTYDVGNLVTTQGRIYRAVVAHTSSAAFDTDRANWTVIKQLGATTWLTATYYYLGDIVFNEGRMYQANTSHTSGTFSTDRANWNVIKQLGFAPFLASTYYYLGDLVFQGNVVYRCTLSHVSGASFDATEATNWSVVMDYVDIPAWVATTYYPVGQLVSNNGVVYYRLTAGTSGATFNATEQANWRVIAPTSTPVNVSTQTIDSAYTVLATDGELRIAPTAPRTITLNSTLPDDKEFGFSGTVSSTNIVTFSAGAGTTIVDPSTGIAGASFSTSTWTNGASYSFTLRKINSVWYVRQ